MDEDGWFVSALMYGGMALETIVAKPLQAAIRMAGLYPRYMLNGGLTIGGAICLWLALRGIHSPLFTWAGLGMLGVSLVMVFYVSEPRAPRQTVTVKNEPDNWFND